LEVRIVPVSVQSEEDEMCQIVSCQELSQKRESRRSELRESAVEGVTTKGIRLYQEDLACELKTVHVL
jgi:hypothetical protein